MDAVPFDRADPGGATRPSPFADAADALRAIAQSIVRTATARLTERHLQLCAPAAALDDAFCARRDETRRRGTLPPLLRAFDAWALDSASEALLCAAVAVTVDSNAAAAVRALDGLPLRAIAALVGCDEAAVSYVLTPFVDDVERAQPTPWIMRLAQGDAVADAALACVTRRAATDAPARSPFSDETLRALALVAERCSATEPFAFVTAPPGYGVVDALTAELAGAGRAVLVVENGATLDTRHARRVAAEAAFFDAIVIVAGGSARYLDAMAACGIALFAVVEAIAPPSPSTRASQVRIDVPLPPTAVRELLWSDALGTRANGGELGTIAATFAVGPATIRAAAALALRTVDGDVGQAQVGAVLAPMTAGRLGPRARLMPETRAEDLLISDELGEQLVALVERMSRRGGTVYTTPSGDVRARDGVVALLTGARGAGKRMAATVIGGALSLPLYAVDAAPFAARWDREAEAELLQLFRSAAAAPLILLIEHADAFVERAVWGALTAIAGASDGLVIVCSDEAQPRADNVEPFAATLHFPLPDEVQRAALFRAWLPIGTALDVEALARRYRLNGGAIRALVTRAAELAAGRGSALDEAALDEAARAR